MTDTKICELLQQNLRAIYGFAFSRLYDKDKAEDLSSEIVVEILSSMENLQDEAAFWGYAWKIAENTFRKFIRREKWAHMIDALDLESSMGVYACSAEDAYVEKEEQNEQLYLLRRELSLLSRTHREVCVAYYVDNKSCPQIAKEQNISVEMVKYYLFKTRKQLKEGIGMTRQLGEKSYNPGIFRPGFWGSYNKYNALLLRRLPGSILLAAYHTPMSAEELSVELGVSMPYLEEELDALEAAGVLLKVGSKYQTKLVIITDAHEKELAKSTSAVCKDIADRVYEDTKTLLPQIRALNFHGNDYDDNRLMFGILNIVLMCGYDLSDEKSPTGAPNKLPLGGEGWVYGFDNDYINSRISGITSASWNKARSAWFSAENYNVIRKCQFYDHSRFWDKIEIMCDAILENAPDKSNDTLPELIESGAITSRDGKLHANFPVFDSSVYEKICDMLRPVAEIVADCMVDVSDKAETMLRECVPDAVKDQCGDIAKIHHRLNVTAFLLEAIIDSGKLTVPSEKTPLCVWGVRA